MNVSISSLKKFCYEWLHQAEQEILPWMSPSDCSRMTSSCPPKKITFTLFTSLFHKQRSNQTMAWRHQPLSCSRTPFSSTKFKTAQRWSHQRSPSELINFLWRGTATIRLSTPKTRVKRLPMKIIAVAGYWLITGTAISPQLSPAMT